jgi:hypothetical protein
VHYIKSCTHARTHAHILPDISHISSQIIHRNPSGLSPTSLRRKRTSFESDCDLFLSCEPHSAPGRVHEHVENAAQSVGGGAMEQFIESPIVRAASRAGEVEDMVGWRRISFDSDSSTKSVDSPVQASWCYYYLWMPANLCKRLRRRQQQQQGHCKWAEPRLERECSGPMRAEPRLDRAESSRPV